MNILIRADSFFKYIGTGHIMRDLVWLKNIKMKISFCYTRFSWKYKSLKLLKLGIK